MARQNKSPSFCSGPSLRLASLAFATDQNKTVPDCSEANLQKEVYTNRKRRGKLLVKPMPSRPMIALLSALCTSIWAGQSSSTTTSPNVGSIQWRAEQAKEHGETSITIHSPHGMVEEVTTLDQALSIYHVVIALPEASITKLSDNYHIFTWYKLKTLETLISHPNRNVPSVSIPDELLPIKASEIVIHVPQGSLTIDGVRVTATDPDSSLLTLHHRYLFFLSPDGSGHFAFLRSGPNSIFAITPDNTFNALLDKNSKMQIDAQGATGGFLATLRESAKAKATELSQQQ